MDSGAVEIRGRAVEDSALAAAQISASVVVTLSQLIELSVKPDVIPHTLRVTAMGPLGLDAKMNVNESRAPFPPGPARLTIRSG